MYLRKLLVWALLVLALPYAVYAQDTVRLTVNGKALPASAIIGSTGTDTAVMATPLLQATGAQVQVEGGRLAAQWPDLTLVLEIGKLECQINGVARPLATPSGAFGDDLVVALNEICELIGARVDTKGGAISVRRDKKSSSRVASAIDTSSLDSSSGRKPKELTEEVQETVPLGRDGSGSNYNQGYGANLNNGSAGSASGNAYNSYNAGTANGSGFPPGFATIPGGTAGAVNNPNARVEVPSNAFPQAGMGGLTDRDPYSSPYDRPSVSSTNLGGQPYTVEVPRDINSLTPYGGLGGVGGVGGVNPSLGVDKYGMPISMNQPTLGQQGSAGSYNPSQGGGAQAPSSSISYGAIPAAKSTGEADASSADSKRSRPLKPGKPEVVALDVQRIMTFHFTIYEIKVKVRNEGEQVIQKPFMLQLLGRGGNTERYSTYELMESYLVSPLEPGQEVEVVKRVDGHMFACLTDLTVHFKALVLEEDVASSSSSGRKSKRSSRRKEQSTSSVPGMHETSSREKSVSF